jgi:hypothetical protein
VADTAAVQCTDLGAEGLMPKSTAGHDPEHSNYMRKNPIKTEHCSKSTIYQIELKPFTIPYSANLRRE